MNELAINPTHLILAYAGMIMHILVKLAELNKEKSFKLKEYIKKNIYTMISSFISIPVILIMATDDSLKDLLPINKVTAVLAGWQTNSIFKSLMTLASKKVITTTTNDTENEGQNNKG
jgi:hypothetical protein